MRKPDESLEDHIVRPAPETGPEPPRSVLLVRTGEVEVLQPLARPDKRARIALRAFTPYQPLWFRRFLVVGSGALVMLAMVLVSAILVGINDSGAVSEVASIETSDSDLTQPQEFAQELNPDPTQLERAEGDPVQSEVPAESVSPVDSFGFEVEYPSNLASATGEIEVAWSNTRRRQARRSIHLAGNNPVRRPRASTQPKFIPTTLVIYAENGVVHSRIEPWLRGGDRKAPSFHN